LLLATVSKPYSYVGSGVRLTLCKARRGLLCKFPNESNGNGGKAIVWADKATGFYGNITAKGGSQSGNGGFVEVSGKQDLVFRGLVDTSAVNGNMGTLLLDPTNITIKNGTGDGSPGGGDYSTETFSGSPSGVTGQVLQTDSEPTIIYESELEDLSGNTNVILEAADNITIEELATLDFKSGSGSITFTADANQDGISAFAMETADAIFAPGRKLTISGASVTTGNIITAEINKNGGDVTINASRGDISTGGIGTASAFRNSGKVELNAAQGNVAVKNIITYSASGNGGDVSLTANNGNGTITIEDSSALRNILQQYIEEYVPAPFSSMLPMPETIDTSVFSEPSSGKAGNINFTGKVLLNSPDIRLKSSSTFKSDGNITFNKTVDGTATSNNFLTLSHFTKYLLQIKREEYNSSLLN
jgi:hypothetical protein